MLLLKALVCGAGCALEPLRLIEGVFVVLLLPHIDKNILEGRSVSDPGGELVGSAFRSPPCSVEFEGYGHVGSDVGEAAHCLIGRERVEDGVARVSNGGMRGVQAAVCLGVRDVESVDARSAWITVVVRHVSVSVLRNLPEGVFVNEALPKIGGAVL